MMDDFNNGFNNDFNNNIYQDELMEDLYVAAADVVGSPRADPTLLVAALRPLDGDETTTAAAVDGHCGRRRRRRA